MSKLRKFRELNWGDWLVLARAVPLLFLCEVGLRVLLFRTLLRWVQTRRRATGSASAPSPERTAWLVNVAARYSLLRSACLVKSLALCALLSRQGLEARLVIGADSTRENFRAHAWVELGGKVLSGQSASGYRELVAFERAAAGRQIA